MLDFEGLCGLMPLWNNAQKPMQETKRWENFPDYGQTLLMHANSFPLVGRMVVTELVARGVVCDQVILMDAFMLHDHGEPPTGGDEHDGNKTEEKPLHEWTAFWALSARLPDATRRSWRRAFALQYCRKDWGRLPLAGRTMVTELCLSHRLESAVFEFCERLDYLQSALEGYGREVEVRNEDETMIFHTVTRQLPKLDALVRGYPDLGKIWTSDLRNKFLTLAKS